MFLVTCFWWLTILFSQAWHLSITLYIPFVCLPGTAQHEDLSVVLHGDGDMVFDVQGTYFAAHKICLTSADTMFQKLITDFEPDEFSHSKASPKLEQRKSESKREDKRNLIENEEIRDSPTSQILENSEGGCKSCRLLNHQGFLQMEDKLLNNRMITVVTVNPEIFSKDMWSYFGIFVHGQSEQDLGLFVRTEGGCWSLDAAVPGAECLKPAVEWRVPQPSSRETFLCWQEQTAAGDRAGVWTLHRLVVHFHHVHAS